MERSGWASPLPIEHGPEVFDSKSECKNSDKTRVGCGHGPAGGVVCGDATRALVLPARKRRRSLRAKAQGKPSHSENDFGALRDATRPACHSVFDATRVVHLPCLNNFDNLRGMDLATGVRCARRDVYR